MESVSDSLHAKAVADQLEKHEGPNCLRAYAQLFQSTRSNFVLVVPDPATEGVGAIARADFAKRDRIIDYFVLGIMLLLRWPNETDQPKGHDSERKRWIEAVGKKRMLVCIGLYGLFSLSLSFLVRLVTDKSGTYFLLVFFSLF